MIKIIKANKHEIIVKQGQSIYSTTPETATPEVKQALQQYTKETQKQDTKKTEDKKTTKKQEDKKTKKTDDK